MELYIEAGVRGVEIGTLLADRDPEASIMHHFTVELVRKENPVLQVPNKLKNPELVEN